MEPRNFAFRRDPGNSVSQLWDPLGCVIPAPPCSPPPFHPGQDLITLSGIPEGHSEEAEGPIALPESR